MHRAGERVADKLGLVTLEPGDSLLLQATEGFADRWSSSGDFAVVAPLSEAPTETAGRRSLVLLTVGAMIVVAASGQVPILLAVLGACAVFLATRTLRFFAAKEALDLDVLIVVASSIGLGAAVESSGLAALVADGLLTIVPDSGPLVPVLAVGALVVTTMVLTELVTNIASVALMVPIGLEVADEITADPRLLVIAVAIAASASFLTPIGYQTNTIVYGLGGYRFGDYARLGAPISALVLVTTVASVALRL
jgi:di/tricarboxylate transporter